jgi:probable F420-dependent oxidoreductase
MEFGMQLTSRGPDANPDAFIAFAEKAEETGLERIWASDHLIVPPQHKTSYFSHPGGKVPDTWKANYFQPFSVLNFLAARTTKARLGTSVLILPMRNPIELAAQVTELDVLSGGRFDFGIGVGWFHEEFEALGYDFTNRGKRTDEALGLMKELWSDGNTTFEGEFHSFSEAIMEPKPVQKPHPPIYIGGGSIHAMRRAARSAQAFQPVKTSPEEFAEIVKTMTELLDQEGRSIDDFIMCPKLGLSFKGGPELTTGTVQDIIDAIHRYEDAGATEMCFDNMLESIDNALDLLDRFAGEVRPKL